MRTLESYIYHSKEESVFTLFDRLACRDLASAQAVLSKILLSRSSDPNAVLSGLLWQIRRLLRFKILLEAGYSSADTFPRLKIWNKRGQKIHLEGHKNYSRTEAEALITLVEEFSIRLRSTASDLGALLIQMFLYYAIVRGGRFPRMQRGQMG